MFDSDNAVLAVNSENYIATMLVEVIQKAGGGYDVTCSDTDVPKGTKKVKLRWEMVTPGWEVIGIHGLFYPEFTFKAKDGHDYKCKDKNSVPENYDYTVIVGNITTKEVLTLDPTVRNGGNN
jgi:hypothetical protein